LKKYLTTSQRDGAFFGAFFIALPSSITKKGFGREQKLHMCEMSGFRLSITVST